MRTELTTGPRGPCIGGKRQGRLRHPSKREPVQGAFSKPRPEPEEKMVHGISVTEKSPMGALKNGDCVTTRYGWRPQRGWSVGMGHPGWPGLQLQLIATHVAFCQGGDCRHVHGGGWEALSSQYWRGEQRQTDTGQAKSTQAYHSRGQWRGLWATLELLENHPDWAKVTTVAGPQIKPLLQHREGGGDLKAP